MLFGIIELNCMDKVSPHQVSGGLTAPGIGSIKPGSAL
jgi:hypothetical protein